MADSDNTQHTTGERTPLPTSIIPVETAVPVFIGYTERRGKNGAPLPVQKIRAVEISHPQKISSMADYEEYFGKAPVANINVTIKESRDYLLDHIVNRTIEITDTISSLHKLYYHLQMYFANGGGSCFIISVGDFSKPQVEADHLLAGIDMATQCEDVTLLVCPQVEDLDAAGAAKVYQTMLYQAGEWGNRFAILDCFDNRDAFRVRDNVGSEYLNYGAVYHPYLKTTLPVLSPDSSIRISYTLNGKLKTEINQVEDLSADLKKTVESEIKQFTVVLPPSSAIAGAYVHNDATKKVWTAPADIVLYEVISPTIGMDEKGQALHIADTFSGKSINVIRQIPNKGPVVIGARTLAGNDNIWRYISMRRTVTMIEFSLRRCMKAFSREPNNVKTWVRIQLLVEKFLMSFWYKGVLQGATPEHAYLVKIGVGESMDEHDINEGRMILEVGIAMILPSDFMILKIVQRMQKD